MMVRNKIVKVHAFPSADTTDMESYLVPLINKKPDQVILHVGTNNLAVNNAKDVSDKRTNLAAVVSQKGIKCSFSEIITRDDELWGKVKDVNRILRESLPEHIKLISNDNIKVGRLNRSVFHLNARGTGAPVYNLIQSMTSPDFYLASI